MGITEHPENMTVGIITLHTAVNEIKPSQPNPNEFST